MDNENDDRGALVVQQDGPLYGRITLLVSDSFTFKVTETRQGMRLDFRRRTPLERLEVWHKKWALGALEDARDGLGEERPHL